MKNNPRLSLLRPDVIDPAQKEDCQAAVSFRSWIKRLFPAILTSEDSGELDVAQLRIAQEYNLRRRGHSLHRVDRCLPDIFHEWMDLLWDRQRSIAPRRIFPEEAAAAPLPPSALPSQALYLGEEEEQPAWAPPP